MNNIKIEVEDIFKGMLLSKKDNINIYNKLKYKYNNNLFNFDLIEDKKQIIYLKEKEIISFFDLSDIYKFYGKACYENSVIKNKIKNIIDDIVKKDESLNAINCYIKSDEELLKYFSNNNFMKKRNINDFQKYKKNKQRGYPQAV